MSDRNNPLEHYVANHLKEVDEYARKTRGSGCGNEIGDVSNKFFYPECKMKMTKANFTFDRKVWLKHLRGLPIVTKKIPFMCFENKLHERYVVLEAEDFFKIVKNLIKEKGEI